MPFLLLIALFHTLSTASYGYVDPGSGHLIWQMLLSVAFGGLFFFRRFITYLFPGKNKTKNTP